MLVFCVPFSAVISRPSHLRRATFGPSKWPTRLAANQKTGVAPVGRSIALIYYHVARLWPAYLMRHGSFLAHLVFENEKAVCISARKKSCRPTISTCLVCSFVM